MSALTELAQSMLALCQQAAAASRQTPTRRGNVIVISPAEADEVMITADLHGHRENFEQLLEIADLAHHVRRHLILQEVCHGGPTSPHGGCQSHTLLEGVIRLKVQYPDRVHFLLSNHELAELTDFPIVKGLRMLNLSFRCGMHEIYGRMADKVREGYVEFLRTCPLAVRLPGGVLVTHSLPEGVDSRSFDTSLFERPLAEEDFREHGPIFQLVWGRDYRPENAAAFARLTNSKVLIHGHDPCPAGFKTPNTLQVILDCCSRPAAYLILPTATPLSYDDIVRQIRLLN